MGKFKVILNESVKDAKAKALGLIHISFNHYEDKNGNKWEYVKNDFVKVIKKSLSKKINDIVKEGSIGSKIELIHPKIEKVNVEKKSYKDYSYLGELAEIINKNKENIKKRFTEWVFLSSEAKKQLDEGFDSLILYKTKDKDYSILIRILNQIGIKTEKNVFDHSWDKSKSRSTKIVNTKEINYNTSPINELEQKAIINECVKNLDKVVEFPKDFPKVNVLFLKEQREDKNGFKVHGHYFTGQNRIQMYSAKSFPKEQINSIFYHELFHSFDNYLGKGNEYNSEKVNGNKFEDLLDVINKSENVKNIKINLKKGKATVSKFKGSELSRPMEMSLDKKHLGYLLEPSELLARGFSQWVSSKVNDYDFYSPTIYDENNYSNQWSKEDFVEISKGFDKLFEEEGWKK